MFHKLEKVTLMTSNCNYHAFTCSCLKPLVLSNLLITLSPRVRLRTRNLFWSWAPSPCFGDLFPSSQSIRTSLSEDDQSSFCPISENNYISVKNCVGNSFLTQMVRVYMWVRVKWHYFIIDLQSSGCLIQHETLRSRINVRIQCIFCN